MYASIDPVYPEITQKKKIKYFDPMVKLIKKQANDLNMLVLKNPC